MSKELLERLRTTKVFGSTLYAEAADEIERLQNELAEQRNIAFAAQKEASRCAELEWELQRLRKPAPMPGNTFNVMKNADCTCQGISLPQSAGHQYPCKLSRPR